MIKNTFILFNINSLYKDLWNVLLDFLAILQLHKVPILGNCEPLRRSQSKRVGYFQTFFVLSLFHFFRLLLCSLYSRRVPFSDYLENLFSCKPIKHSGIKRSSLQEPSNHICPWKYPVELLITLSHAPPRSGAPCLVRYLLWYSEWLSS